MRFCFIGKHRLDPFKTFRISDTLCYNNTSFLNRWVGFLRPTL
nr:MAG TPA: hypothetical protein [Caudoviricetes sp.]